MKHMVATAKLLLTACLIVIFHKVKSCEVPFSDFQGSCYTVGKQLANWDDALRYCQSQKSTLVSIHSTDELHFLQGLARNWRDDWRWRIFWIGLNALDDDGRFKWTDNTAVDYTNFDEKEPNNVEDKERCVTLNNNNGRWNDDHCDKQFGYICKLVDNTQVSTTIPTTQNPRKGNCWKGWIPHLDQCYYIGGKREEERLNWTEARDFCNEKNGYLTSIRDSMDQSFLAYLLQIIGEDTWIGFHSSSPDFRYVWLNNSDIDYTNWGGYTTGHKKNCVKMVYKHVDSGVWMEEECDRKLGFICQANKDRNLSPVHFVHNRDITCSHHKGWLKLSNMCFRLFEERPLTWHKAEHSCKNLGGHLVSVYNPSVKALVVHLARDLNQPFFIGLKYDKKSHSFKWINNFPVTLSMWDKNEPSSITDNSCFASTSEGYWKKIACDEKLPYLCQITTDKPKLNKYVGDCRSTYGRAGNNSYCYIQKWKEMDYYTARTQCHDYDSHLISLHSMEEIEDVKKIINPGTEYIYLGLEKNVKGGYRWSDDSPVNFVNWAEGQPHNRKDSCVYMSTFNMKWSVTDCATKEDFICMEFKKTLVVEEIETELYIPGAKAKNIVPGVVLGILLLIGLISVILFYIIKKRKGWACMDPTSASRKDAHMSEKIPMCPDENKSYN